MKAVGSSPSPGSGPCPGPPLAPIQMWIHVETFAVVEGEGRGEFTLS